MSIALIQLSIEIMFDKIVLPIFILLITRKSLLFDGVLARFLNDIIVEHLVVVVCTASVYASII